MLRKFFVFALILIVLAVATVQPSYAQSGNRGERETIVLQDVARSNRNLPTPYKSFKFLVKGDIGGDVRIGERHSADKFGIEGANPPPPMPYHVWYWLPDLGLVLDCVYDDDTGELEYCDIYA